MLYLAGIIITFFLAAILVSKRGKSAADRVLAAWLAVIGIHLFLFYWQISGQIYEYPWLLGIQVPMPLLHGPLLYIYTLTATRSNRFAPSSWLHFIPPALGYAILADFFLLPGKEKIAVYAAEGAGYEWQTGLIFIALILSGFAYVFLSIRELRRYRKQIADEFSNTEKINLNWLRYLIYGILGIWLVVALNGEDFLIFAAVVLFVLLLGYFGIKHLGIFTYRQVIIKELPLPAAQPKTPSAASPEIKMARDEPGETPGPETFGEGENGFATDEETVPAVRYEKSGLQQEAVDRIHRELSHLMETEKVYKDAELSLAGLASRLQVHPNNLSQVINSQEQRNFYDYINQYRIGEFKNLALLPENSRYTLLSLAFECGFNSKTSFNRNFKKITGQSPSAWLKEADIRLPAG